MPARHTYAIDYFEIPQDKDAWRQIVDEHHLSQKMIHDLDHLESGSDVHDTQFMAFRAIWPPAKRPWVFELDRTEYGIDDELWNQAQGLLNRVADWQRYLSIVQRQAEVQALHILNDSEQWPGVFVPVRTAQEQTLSGDKLTREQSRHTPFLSSVASRTRAPLGDRLLRSVRLKGESMRQPIQPMYGGGHASVSPQSSQLSLPSSLFAQTRPSGAEAEDEQVVNYALVLLLENLRQLVAGSKEQWIMAREGFQSRFRKAEYRAYTDGVLRRRGGEKISSILEVKKKTRRTVGKALKFQETAEVVGWIIKDPDTVPGFRNQ
jgi:hypothetical protein